MTSRERVIRAIGHRETDRVPVEEKNRHFKNILSRIERGLA